MTPTEKFDAELAAQKERLWLFKMSNGIFAVVLFFILFNGHPFPSLLGLAILAANVGRRGGRLLDEFEERKAAVAFKAQVENIYVFSERGTSDAWARAQFEFALANLRDYGNENEVRVHLAMFRDVCVFTSYWNMKGVRVNDRSWRDKGAGAETWEEYLKFQADFRAKEDDRRKRELRGDNTGREWVDAHVFGQRNKWN